MNERAVLEGVTVLLVLLEAEFRMYSVESELYTVVGEKKGRTVTVSIDT